MPFGSWWMKQNTHLLAQVAISDGVGGTSSTPSSPARRITVTVVRAPPRSTSRSSCSSAAWNWKSMASRSGWPLIARTRSPAASPATAAAVRRRTSATTTPSAAEEHAFIGLRPLGRVGRVQIAHALDQVLQTRHDRERRGQPHDRAGGNRQAEVPHEETVQHGEDLEKSRRLTGPR